MNEQRKDLFPITSHASAQKAIPWKALESECGYLISVATRYFITQWIFAIHKNKNNS